MILGQHPKFQEFAREKLPHYHFNVPKTIISEKVNYATSHALLKKLIGKPLTNLELLRNQRKMLLWKEDLVVIVKKLVLILIQTNPSPNAKFCWESPS
jgi:hypothetical protein